MNPSTDGVKAPDRLAEVPVLAWGMAGVCKACGISRSTLERLRSAGKFPRPDRTVGRKPLWRVETVRAWLGGDAGGGRR